MAQIPETIANHDLRLFGPPRGGRTLVFGTLLVGSSILLFFANLQRRQNNKELLDQSTHSAIPTWQHRVHQSNHPLLYASLPIIHASGVETRIPPLSAPVKEHNKGHVTIKDYLARPNNTPEGRWQQPTPQRDRGDGSGFAYTKSIDYCTSYEKTPKYWRKKVREDAKILNPNQSLSGGSKL